MRNLSTDTEGWKCNGRWNISGIRNSVELGLMATQFDCVSFLIIMERIQRSDSYTIDGNFVFAEVIPSPGFPILVSSAGFFFLCTLRVCNSYWWKFDQFSSGLGSSIRTIMLPEK